MPESTLTPAPVMVTTFPGARKAAILSTAALGLMDAAEDVDDKIAAGIVGTEMRMVGVPCDWRAGDEWRRESS
jgi:hypothetical protein